jgi:hypothetical protein
MTFRETHVQEEATELVPTAALGAAEEEPRPAVLTDEEADDIQPVPEEAFTPLPAKARIRSGSISRRSARSPC